MATSGRRLSVDIDVHGIAPLLAEMRRMGPEVNAEVRDASQGIAGELAQRLRRTAGGGPTRQREAIAHTVRVRRDRVPKVVIGGAGRAAVSRPLRGRRKGTRSMQKRPTAGQLVRGVEWGAHTNSWRFPYPYRVSGYWVGPAVEVLGPMMVDRWLDALERILNRRPGHG